MSGWRLPVGVEAHRPPVADLGRPGARRRGGSRPCRRRAPLGSARRRSCSLSHDAPPDRHHAAGPALSNGGALSRRRTARRGRGGHAGVGARPAVVRRAQGGRQLSGGPAPFRPRRSVVARDRGRRRRRGGALRAGQQGRRHRRRHPERPARPRRAGRRRPLRSSSGSTSALCGLYTLTRSGSAASSERRLAPTSSPPSPPPSGNEPPRAPEDASERLSSPRRRPRGSLASSSLDRLVWMSSAGRRGTPHGPCR